MRSISKLPFFSLVLLRCQLTLPRSSDWSVCGSSTHARLNSRSSSSLLLTSSYPIDGVRTRSHSTTMRVDAYSMAQATRKSFHAASLLRGVAGNGCGLTRVASTRGAALSCPKRSIRCGNGMAKRRSAMHIYQTCRRRP
jgi:hypothetical protein